MSELIRAAQAIHKAKAVLITAGAGIGVDSGLPDFRGPNGFWKVYPPLQKLGIRFEEMANPFWFHKNPHLAWGFYGHRLELYRKTVPHKGFHILQEMCKNKNSFVFTSNVDGQFQKAGFSEDKIYECHGSIHHTQCLSSCASEIQPADFSVNVDSETLLAKDPLPKCKKCGSLLRPNILLFGDMSWLEERSEEQSARFEKFLGSVKARDPFVVLEVGAGTAVSTVRSTSERICNEKKGTLIRINPDDPSLDRGSMWGWTRYDHKK
eukprot:Phypoly_transcript_13781.p1 GENE.Phypoly_transcript_13781~~Phypoly_transcript_13781.p1  ORF type:complete len:265 (+),score=29.70 Phypoly_transcript_13781:89-883(+)